MSTTLKLALAVLALGGPASVLGAAHTSACGMAIQPGGVCGMQEDGDQDFTKFCGDECVNSVNGGQCDAMVTAAGEDGGAVITSMLASRGFLCGCYIHIGEVCDTGEDDSDDGHEDGDHKKFRLLLAAHEEGPSEACCAAIMGNAACTTETIPAGMDEDGEVQKGLEYCKKQKAEWLLRNPSAAESGAGALTASTLFIVAAFAAQY